MGHIREGPSVFSGTQESDSNDIVVDGPFPPSSNPRPNVELDTTVPPTVEVSEPIEGQESDGESSHDSPRVVSHYPQRERRAPDYCFFYYVLTKGGGDVVFDHCMC